MSHTDTLESQVEYSEEDLYDPVFDSGQKTISKIKQSSNFLQRYSKTLSEQETTLGSNLNNSQLFNTRGKIKEGDRYNTQEKSSLIMENMDDSFQNDTLSSVSKRESLGLNSGRMGECLTLSDRMGYDVNGYDNGNHSAMKMSTRSLIDQEVKANNFYHLKLNGKIFGKMKEGVNAKRRIQQLFTDAYELEKQKNLINLTFDLKKIATYINVKRKNSSFKSNNCSRASINRTSMDNYDHDTGKYDYYFLIKKAFKVLKTRAYHKSLKHKAEKFLYYKLLLKYTYAWIDYVRNKPVTIESIMTSRVFPIEYHDDKLISPFQSKRSYRCSTMLNETIEEEKHPFTKYYEDNLVLKSLNALKANCVKQKKKRDLEEILLDSLETKYVFKPFRAWFYQTKYRKLKRRAVIKISQMLYLSLTRFAFNKIKNTKKDPIPQRIPGVILNQSHIIKRNRTNNYSQDFSRRAVRMKENENSFSYNEKTSNLNKSSYIDKSDSRQNFKNYLSGVFPIQKRDTRILQQNPNRSNIQQQATEYSLNSQSFLLPRTFLLANQTNQTEDSAISLTLDTSHFGAPENFGNFGDSKQIVLTNVDKSYIQPNKALDHSLFRLNASKIEKENKPAQKPVKARHSRNENESSFLQRSIQSRYFLTAKKEQENSFQSRKQSPSPIPTKANSSFSILDTSMQGVDKKGNISVVNVVEKMPLGEVQENKMISSKPVLTKQRSSSTGLKMRIDVVQPKVKAESKKVMKKEDSKTEKVRFKNMIDDLEEHLKFLNRNLMNQQLINKKLTSIKSQLSTET